MFRLIEYLKMLQSDLSPRPTWPENAEAEAFKSTVQTTRFDIDSQTRASNQLLWSMENNMAEEAVMMDEIDVLLRVMRDNLTPSLTTSETQVCILKLNIPLLKMAGKYLSRTLIFAFCSTWIPIGG